MRVRVKLRDDDGCIAGSLARRRRAVERWWKSVGERWRVSGLQTRVKGNSP